jgi:hypothetical protein
MTCGLGCGLAASEITFVSMRKLTALSHAPQPLTARSQGQRPKRGGKKKFRERARTGGSLFPFLDRNQNGRWPAVFRNDLGSIVLRLLDYLVKPRRSGQNQYMADWLLGLIIIVTTTILL